MLRQFRWRRSAAPPTPSRRDQLCLERPPPERCNGTCNKREDRCRTKCGNPGGAPGTTPPGSSGRVVFRFGAKPQGEKARTPRLCETGKRGAMQQRGVRPGCILFRPLDRHEYGRQVSE